MPLGGARALHDGQALTARRAYQPIAHRDDVKPAAPPLSDRLSRDDMEQRLAPLRGISRELVSRGMPAALVSELLSEIVAEFGNQVLESERNARLALVEQLLLRIPQTPLADPDTPLHGIYLVTGPAGSGKSVLIAHLALMAARQGHGEVILVNTESARIGAAAQMNALGTVFGYDVEHVYTPQELRQLATRRGPRALMLVETAGWSPGDAGLRPAHAGASTSTATPWKWRLSNATFVVCVPAPGQSDDLQSLLTQTREQVPDAVSVLCKTSETRNVLPALGALALARQPVGMVVPGPNLADDTGPLDLAEIARSSLGVVMPRHKKGRVRC